MKWWIDSGGTCSSAGLNVIRNLIEPPTVSNPVSIIGNRGAPLLCWEDDERGDQLDFNE